MVLPFSYKPLWKLLIDRDMSKKELMEKTGISKSTIDKMGRSEHISMDILERLCDFFDCQVEDILKYTKE